MITLIKNIDCYCPKYIGKKDILIAGDKIYKIQEPDICIDYTNIANIIPCDGLLAFPGMIDGHVHIIGGGGEKGFVSRIDEINIEDIITAGITTLVGLLGADDQTKNLNSLLAKARALETQGITTFIYVGSYGIPSITLTSDITSDIVLIDKAIGVGEVAISDHRSSQPDLKEMTQMAAKAHMGGLISGKAGVVHIHVGDGKSGIQLITELTSKSDLPIEQFVPTHVNRNRPLFKQAIAYCQSGGNIDLTSGEEAGITVPDAIQSLIDNKVDLRKVTISSDANGSIPNGGIGKIQTLYDDVISCIKCKQISPETAFGFVTENVAKRLKQFPRKGTLSEGSDADIIITDTDYKLQKLFSMGSLLIGSENGSIQ